jgi:MoxR-like ATPase
VSEFEFLGEAHRLGYSVLIDGPTGTGKTSAVYAYAARNNFPVYSVPCNGAADPAMLFGTYAPKKTGAGYVWQDGPVTKLARHGGVLLLNEVNFLPAKVAATMFGLTDKRRTISLVENGGEIIIANSKLLVIGDYNPDYEGTRPLNYAFKNRFAVKMSFDYDDVTEEQLVFSNTLLRIARQIRAQHNEGNIETPVATNQLMEFEQLAQAVSFDGAIDNFVNAFSADEKMAVKNVFDLNRADLEREYGVEYED